MNPYRMVGQVAMGDRFIDRPELTRLICSAWEEPGRPSNLCMLGYHRTGKTSLVKHAVAHSRRDDLITVWINVGRHASGPDLFRSMVRDVLNQIGDHDQLGAIGSVALTTESWYDLDNAITVFFNQVQKTEKAVLVVLDEFDRAAKICKRLSEFQLLRDLASEPQFPVGLVTISRRPIQEIEVDAAGGSILDGVVTTRRYVGMFTDVQADVMLSRAAQAGVDLAPVREEIIELSGLHPFLLESLCNSIVELHRETGKLDMDLAFDQVMGVFHAQFQRFIESILIDTSKKGITLLKLLAEGGAPDTPSLDLNRFQRMGLVSRIQGRPVLFSAEFARYVLAAEI
jgi:hypothetical protein